MLDQFFSHISFVDIFNFCVFLAFTICYTYQLYYVFVVLTRKPKQLVAKKNHKLRRRHQRRATKARSSASSSTRSRCRTTPSELIDMFVIADNCTDNTAEVAREAGAMRVPRASITEQVGKGYALDFGFCSTSAATTPIDAYDGLLRLRRRQRARRRTTSAR